MVTQTMIRKRGGKQVLGEKETKYPTDFNLKNALKGPNYLFHSTSAHLFLSYHLK